MDYNQRLAYAKQHGMKSTDVWWPAAEAAVELYRLQMLEVVYRGPMHKIFGAELVEEAFNAVVYDQFLHDETTIEDEVLKMAQRLILFRTKGVVQL